MNWIIEFYESNHFLVLIVVILLFGIYIFSTKKRKNINIKQVSKPEKNKKIQESIFPESSIDNEVLPIELIPENSEYFLQILLKTKKAQIITYYKNGTTESKIWNATKMTADSNLIHNLRSRPEFRNPNWQNAEIIKVVAKVINYKEEKVVQTSTLITKATQGNLTGEKLIVSYFILDKNWFGQNKTITVTFNNGKHKGKKYQYNHDEVYNATIEQYKTKDSWKNYGRFSNSRNIPEICRQFVTEII